MRDKCIKLDFKGQDIYVGLDVHLKSWKCTPMSKQSVFKSTVHPPESKGLLAYLEREFPGGNFIAGYESGFCGFWIQKELSKMGIRTVVLNAGDIPTNNKERVQKEDKRDSRKIARVLCSGDYEEVYVPGDKTLEDRFLLRTRATMVKDMARNKHRIKSMLYFNGIKFPEEFDKSQNHWSKRFMKWLSELKFSYESGNAALSEILTQSEHFRSRILNITRMVQALSKTEDYEKREKLLRSIPGIGLINAMTILTELETIKRFDNLDKLCSYIGLIPSTDSSGDNDVVGDITPRGHSVLRSAIIESSWVAIRHDPALFHKYNQLSQRMEANEAIIRIAKKLLNRIRYVLKNEKEYEKSTVK